MSTQQVEDRREVSRLYGGTSTGSASGRAARSIHEERQADVSHSLNDGSIGRAKADLDSWNERSGAATAGELDIIEDLIGKLNRPDDYYIEVAENAIVIHEAERFTPSSHSSRFDFLLNFLDNILEGGGDYAAVLRFVLIDVNERMFVVERFCFDSRIDGWIYLSGPDSLKKLAASYIPHLGRKSFYSLH